MSTPSFEDRIIAFVTRLCESGHPVVTADTALFDHHLLNSMRIIDLVAFVESEVGRPVPDHQLTMNFFRTPRTIAKTFGGEKGSDS